MSFDEWIGSGIPDEITEQAAQWITRLDSETVTDQDRRDFSSWLDNKPMNRWAFEELSEMWARLETLGEHRHLLHESKILSFPTKTPKETANYDPSTWQSITAITLIIIGLIIPIIEKLVL